MILGDEETIEVLEAAGSGSWVWEFKFATPKLFKCFTKQFEIACSCYM